MPVVIPPDECGVCQEVAPSMKVLPSCAHKFCLQCTEELVEEDTGHHRKTIICPLCRVKSAFSSLNKLPTYHFGSLECDLCSEMKKDDDVWWCPTCIRVICSKCCIKDHENTGHHVSPWDTMQAFKDICHASYTQTAEASSGKRAVSPSDLEKIDSFLKEVKEGILSRLEQADAHPKIPFHQYMEELIGQIDTETANTINMAENSEKVNKVGQKIIKLCLGEMSEEVWKTVAKPVHKVYHGPIDHFDGSAQKLANEIWRSIQFKKPHVDQQQGLSTSRKNVYGLDYLQYMGNGENFQKFFQDILRNGRDNEGIVVVVQERWIPVTLHKTLDKFQKTCQLAVYTTPTALSEESENNLFHTVSQLFSLLPGLDFLRVQSYGHSVPKLEMLWPEVPEATRGFGVFDVPLSDNGIRAVVDTIVRKPEIDKLVISMTENSSRSLLLLIQQVKNVGKIKQLYVREAGEDLKELLEQIAQWKCDIDRLTLTFPSLSDNQVVLLWKKIPKMRSVKALRLTTAQVEMEEGEVELLTDCCGRNSIAFWYEFTVLT